MYKELLATVYFADQLNQSAIGKEFASDAKELKAAIQKHCWDERDGFFYSVDLNLQPVTNEPDNTLGRTFIIHAGYPNDYDCLIQRIEVWTGFMALWAGIATPEKAERIVKEHYSNPKTFNSASGVRTLSKMEKMYSLRASANPSNWRGPIWGISNYMVFKGFQNWNYLVINMIAWFEGKSIVEEF